MRTIAHVYPTYAEAARVVQALESAGIPHDNISIVSGDKTVGTTGYDDMGTTGTGTGTGLTSGDPDQGAATGAGTGATLGTVLGGGAGLLAGIGALAIPGLGPIVAAGWLVAALTGAGVGAAAGSLLGSLTGAGISEADAHTYQEHVNQGGTLVTVRADDSQASHVEQLMGMTTGFASTATTGVMGATGAATGVMHDTTRETTASRDAEMGAGTMNTGAMGVMPAAPLGTTTTNTGLNTGTSTGMNTGMNTGAANAGDTIKVMKEDLTVGKRAVEEGGVRVTSHVVETPVQEQVTLHEERVTIDRHPVNQRVTGTGDAFTNQTIEARATSEEPVVAKDVRVVEEIGLHKQATDRVETIRDTVRETKVDVEDTSRPATTTDTTKRV